MRLAAALLSLVLGACGGSYSPEKVIPPVNAAPVPPAAGPGYQTEWTQYRNSTIPARNLTNGGCWYPGIALTASSNTIYFGWLKPVLHARWLVVYTPNGGGAKLISADDGPSNEVELASVYDQRGTPITAGGDLTTTINDLIASGVRKQLILQVCGPALVYLSTIEVVW